MPWSPCVLLLLQANKLVKYLMIKDYKKIPIKRSGGQPGPPPRALPFHHPVPIPTLRGLASDVSMQHAPLITPFAQYGGGEGSRRCSPQQG